MKKSLILPFLTTIALGLVGCSTNANQNQNNEKTSISSTTPIQPQSSSKSSSQSSSNYQDKIRASANGYNDEMTVENVTYKVLSAKVQPVSKLPHLDSEITAPNVVSVRYNVKNNSDKVIEIGKFNQITMFNGNKKLKPYYYANLDKDSLAPGTEIDANIAFSTDGPGNFQIGFAPFDPASYKDIDELAEKGYGTINFDVSTISE